MSKDSALAKRVSKIMHEHAPEARDIEWTLDDQRIDDDENDDDQPLPPQVVAERRKQRAMLGIDDEVFRGNFIELNVASTLLRRKPALMDALAPLRAEHTAG